MNKLYTYQNGNTVVTIENDGTKTRTWKNGEKAIPVFPESIDLKITNYCDMGNHCQWCHENSNKNGKHARLDYLLDRLSDLPNGVELAIGGGNPLSHPDLIPFLEKLKEMNLIPNMTINQLHVKQYFKTIKYIIENNLVYGVGVSFNNVNMKETKELLKLTDNIVFHLIIGVNNLDDMNEIFKIHNKVLLLGYKQFRKGIDYFSNSVTKNIQQWYMRLPLFFDKMHITFDNLAIKQLNLKRYFTDHAWEKFYMGDDGTFTFYIDGVNEKYSKNSTSNITYDIEKKNTSEMFKNL